MDRDLLADWGLELADDAFARALAALGVLAGLDRVPKDEVRDADGWRIDRLPGVFQLAAERGEGVLDWRLPSIAGRSPTPKIRLVGADARTRAAMLSAPPAAALAQVWREFLGRVAPAGLGGVVGPRLAVESAPEAVGRALSMAALLARPEVGAGGVFLTGAFPADGRVDWRWPFTIATLPGDPLAPALEDLQRQLPPTWPYAFAVAGRERARFEVLVVGAGAADALERVLSSGLPLRCALVIVAGLGNDPPRAAEPLLRALASRVAAEGVAVLGPGSSPYDYRQRLQQFADELSHNQTLDVALMQAFGPGAMLMLNRDLLALSRLDTAVDRVSARLRALPPAQGLRLSDAARERLGVPPDDRLRGSPPEDRLLGSPPDDRLLGSPPDDMLLGGGAAAAAAPEPAGAATPADIADAIGSARHRYRFDHESGEASAIAELSRRLTEQEREAAQREAVPRFVQQRSFRKRDGRFFEERSGYVVGQPVMVQVHIGPKGADAVAAPTAFPEQLLPPSSEGHRLQVVLHEPHQFEQPMLQEIVLPPRGDSGVARFVFTPKAAGPFEARLSVLHRGRVLQTVLLRTSVAAEVGIGRAASGIALDDETQVRHDWSDLGRRLPFDLAVILNHTSTGAPLLTGVAGSRAWATNLAGIEQPVRKLNDLISAVAHSVADYGDGLDQGENPALLVKLARVGSNLYSLLYRDQLEQLATDGLDIGDEKVQYLQVVSARADAVVPLEFMYDFNAPDPDASVCPQHRQALEQGKCPADCARAAKPRAHVCPMGFWSLKKVIERHLFDPKAAPPAGAEVVVQVEAIEGRDRLDLGAGALVGHSKEVAPSEVAALVTKLRAGLGSDVPVVKDWDEWAAAVRSRHPALLVAFPHNEGKEEDVLLEIGGKKLYTLDLPADYVRTTEGPPPLVFLLGCDVAGTAQEFSSHIRYFRQAGAAVVVSTIATVFGAHAVRVGEAIVSGLLDAGASGHTRLGEVIRAAKRAALLRSVPMALCVVAFGDADWRL